MSEKSPAQAAYEAWQRVRFPDSPVPWGHPALGSRTRNAWDAASQAGAVQVREQLAAATAELARVTALVGQALDDAGVDDDTKAQWLERAGLETA